MRTTPPPLLPILRTRAQAEILTALLLNPDKEYSITELAARVGKSLPTVSREVSIAEEVGLVSVTRVGTSKLVRADTTGRYYGPLSQLLLMAFGPKQMLNQALSGIQGIDCTYIFGSWARRYRGTRGRCPNDVDVLVVGSPERGAVYDAVEPVERKIGYEVHVTFRTIDEWENKEDSFIATVRSGALVPVLLQDGKAGSRAEAASSGGGAGGPA